ncbi:MAG: GFA family protein [Pirellulales bacterium]
MEQAADTHEGHCSCGFVRYRMASAPMIVHACHCSWCQRESGGPFVVNAVIEATRVALLEGEVSLLLTPSQSGKGQKIARCPRCQVALWSHYPNAGERICFVRVGTLEAPGRLPPDVHIFTSTRQTWLPLPEGALAVPEFYDPAQVWSPGLRARWKAALA